MLVVIRNDAAAADVGAQNLQPSSLAVDSKGRLLVVATVSPGAANPWLKKLLAALSTTVAEVKATAGTWGGYYIFNPNSSPAYVQVFDVVSATVVTLGTTVPDMSYGIPAGGGANLEITSGVGMANGIKVAATTDATGDTAPTTPLDMVAYYL